MRPTEEVLGGEEPEGDRAVLRTELRLAGPSVELLARLGSQPDPLQPFAAAIAGLDPQRTEGSRRDRGGRELGCGCGTCCD